MLSVGVQPFAGPVRTAALQSRRDEKSLLAAFTAFAVTIATPAAPAGAAANDGRSAGSNGVSVYDPTTKRTFVPTDTAQAHQRIAAYWTPARRAAAKNLDARPVTQSSTVDRGLSRCSIINSDQN